MKGMKNQITNSRILNTGLVIWISIVLGRSFFIWFDWETVRFFVQTRPGQYRWLSPWWSGWVDLSDYGIEVASQTIRPLMTWSFQIESLLFGSWAPGYHLLNFAAHLSCMFLLIRFLKKHQISQPLAMLSGLLFALHPLSTQPLWILGDRAEVFVLLGGLIALNWYPRKQWIVAAGLFTALYSKETAITIPAWLLLYDLLFLDKNISFVKSLKKRLYRLLPSFGLTAGYLLHRTLVFSGKGGYRSVDHLQFDYYFDVVSQNIAWLLTLPHGHTLIALIVISFVILFSLVFKSKMVLFGIGWFFIFLLPTHNLCNKWYLYSSVAAFIAILSGICQQLLSFEYLRKPLYIALYVIATWFSFTSYAELYHQQRNADVPRQLAEQLKKILPDIPQDTKVRFVLPANLDPYELKGHYFDPSSFIVKTDKTPIESIVWDLNSTRYLKDMTPVWTRSVEAAIQLYYNDISLRVILTSSIKSKHQQHVNIFYQPGKELELIRN